MSTVSEILVRVNADIKGLQRGLATSSAQLKAFGATSTKTAAESGAAASKIGSSFSAAGAKMSSVGRSLTHNISLPLVGVGVVAGKLAVDFEDSFTKISAVSNASARDVAVWKGEVLSLAGKTAQAPQDLADALYFLASAGLKANQIMPTLSSSAKASAAGLGATADIAKLTANVLNAYASSGLTAAHATDILVSAVKEGTASPEEFATAMGRILPIASKTKVSFDEVAGSLASLSNIGLDVNEGVTAMRGVLQALAAPTSTAAKALDSMGISTNQLRAVLADRGILGALQLLQDRTHGNIDAMHAIVPNIRALTGVLGLTGDSAKQVAGIFDHVKHSTGALDEAWRKTTRGPAFKFRQGLTDLKVAGIQLGERLIPIGLKVVGMVEEWTKAFSDLSPAQQDVIVKAGLFAIALGPVLRIAGGLTKGIGGLVSGFGALQRTFKLSTAAAGAWGVAIGLSALAAEKVAGFLHADDDKAKEWTKSILAGKSSLESYRTTVASVTGDKSLSDKWNGDQTVLDAFGKTVEKVTGFYTGLAARTGASAGVQGEFAAAMDTAQGVTKKQARALADAFSAVGQLNGVVPRLTQFQVKNLLATGDVSGALKILRSRYEDLFHPLLKAADTQGQAAENAAQAGLKFDIERHSIKLLQGVLDPSTRKVKSFGDAQQQLAESIAGANLKMQIQLSLLDRLNHTGGSGRGGRGGAPAGSGSGGMGGPVFHLGGFVPASVEVAAHAARRMHVGGLAAGEVPLIAQVGEFVVQKRAVEAIGIPALMAINRLHEGGAVGVRPPLALASGPPTGQQNEAGLEQAFRRALRAELPGALLNQRVKIIVDRKKFSRSLDDDVLSDGHW